MLGNFCSDTQDDCGYKAEMHDAGRQGVETGYRSGVILFRLRMSSTSPRGF